jgi:hypothetical protein
MNTLMRKIRLFAVILFTISFLSSFSITAQNKTEKSNPFKANVDIMSRYIWRGTDFGNSPSIQPSISYTNSNFTFGTWGAYTTNTQSLQEADIYVSYAFSKLFSLTFTDYFFPNQDSSNDKYFNYNDTSTGHVIEASVNYTFSKKIPLSLLVATNIFGADARRINNDETIGKKQFSTYAELNYAFKNIDVFLGSNLTNPDENIGETGYYGNSIGVINIGATVTKQLKFTEIYSLPLTISLITNPQTQKIFLVAGFSF